MYVVTLFTKNMQVGPGRDGGDTAAPKWCFTLIVATIANCRQADDQSTAKIANPCIDHCPVFSPSDTHFDKRPEKEKEEKEKKRARDRERGF